MGCLYQMTKLIMKLWPKFCLVILRKISGPQSNELFQIEEQIPQGPTKTHRSILFLLCFKYLLRIGVNRFLFGKASPSTTKAKIRVSSGLDSATVEIPFEVLFLWAPLSSSTLKIDENWRVLKTTRWPVLCAFEHAAGHHHEKLQGDGGSCFFVGPCLFAWVDAVANIANG